MKIILPVPPSVNALYANRKRGGRFKTKEYRSWLDQAGWHYLMACKGRNTRGDINSVHGPYAVHIRVPQNTRGDIDNRVKPLLDFLVSMHLTDDDRHCQCATIERSPDVSIYAEIEVRAA